MQRNVRTHVISFSISVLFSQRTHVNLIDLVKSEYLFPRFGFDTAENESSKVCQKVFRQLDRLSWDKHRYTMSYDDCCTAEKAANMPIPMFYLTPSLATDFSNF